MKRIIVLLAVVLMASPAMAWTVVGSHQSWTMPGDEMTEVIEDVHYQYTINGSGRLEFKVADGTSSWDNVWPANNREAKLADPGQLVVNFYPGTFDDGWFPSEKRVGYEDPEEYNWDIMGSFNGWAEPLAEMVPQGDGLYTIEFTAPTAGDHWFKFRKIGDWDVTWGNDEAGGDIPYHVENDGDLVCLALDLPNGRYIPEPASLMLLAFGGIAMLRRRR
ncbi:MAG: PEP-CTERM sorting domain-containing protein [Phycisphaerae bacterium]|nr:PEP-CTERM sorting domain-containing protein [Phycisphaerae bacterium]